MTNAELRNKLADVICAARRLYRKDIKKRKRERTTFDLGLWGGCIYVARRMGRLIPK